MFQTRVLSDIYPKLIEYVGFGKWRIRWNIQLETIEDRQIFVYCETEVNQKPTLDQIKTIIVNWINSKIDNQILNTCVWKDLKIWLTTENQFNYKAAYDLAIQTNGQNLPITFKFGDNENPQYYTFDSLEELSEFYMYVINHIQRTLEAGWSEKDSFDFTQFNNYL